MIIYGVVVTTNKQIKLHLISFLPPCHLSAVTHWQTSQVSVIEVKAGEREEEDEGLLKCSWFWLNPPSQVNKSIKMLGKKMMIRGKILCWNILWKGGEQIKQFEINANIGNSVLNIC